jgi:hypothetical protein
MGHTMSIHSKNEQVILEFGLHKPAYRIVVNSPTTHGSVGLSTGLDPAMTLGCGGYGGNITSDNISPRHLLNIKRLAYEVTPVVSRWDGPSARAAATTAGPLPSGPARHGAPTGISADALTTRIDQFLSSRGIKSGSDPKAAAVAARGSDPKPLPVEPLGSDPKTNAPLDFVCEDDVRAAIQAGRQLVLAERAIVTPAARDLGEQHRIFTVAPWRG